MPIRHLLTVALCCLTLLLVSSCEEDDGPVKPPEYECITQRQGEIVGDHVHGGAVICRVYVLIEYYENQMIDVTRGETNHTHFLMINGAIARRVFDGQTVYLTTSAAGSSHQHQVIYNGS